MDQITVPVQKKELSGKKAVKALKYAGSIPAVVYNKEMNMPLSLKMTDLRELRKLRMTENMIVNLDVNGEESISSIIYDYQMHPLTDEIIHVDFLKIDLDKPLSVAVNVVLKGEAIGVKHGGLVEQTMQTIYLTALPTVMPLEVVLDITELEANHSLHASDIVLPEGVTFADDPSQTVVVCSATVEEEEEAEGEEAAPAA